MEYANCALRSWKLVTIWFFGCGFTKVIWEGILQLCQLQTQAGNWQHELMWTMKRLKGKALITIVLKLGWNACIYWILKERNNRHFIAVQMTEAEVLNKIKE
ncbi:hypothetical protein Gohar_023894, partial [Gossypium harknessii]|nr:hypothetical protein [Gossypium harknessii]